MRRFTFAIVLLVSLSVWAVWPRSTANPAETPQNAPQAVSRPLEYVDPTPEAFIAEVGPAAQFVAELVYAQLIENELGRRAELARVTAASAVKAPVHAAPSKSGTVGDCVGFSIPDYIIQRESGGNPSAYNPSGAYGCAQTLLTHYSRGSCQGHDPYTIEGQRACVDILSNGGSNLNPWAATR
jgi:hypothetical protein